MEPIRKCPVEVDGGLYEWSAATDELTSWKGSSPSRRGKVKVGRIGDTVASACARYAYRGILRDYELSIECNRKTGELQHRECRAVGSMAGPRESSAVATTARHAEEEEEVREAYVPVLVSVVRACIRKGLI